MAKVQQNPYWQEGYEHAKRGGARFQCPYVRRLSVAHWLAGYEAAASRGHGDGVAIMAGV